MADRRASAETPSQATEDFEAFYAKWIIEQQRFLEQLISLSSQNDEFCEQEEELVKEVMWHYISYYEEKAKAMARDELCFLLFFSPPWQNSLEKVILWMGGFTPSFALSLLESSVKDLSSEQRRSVEEVKEAVEEEERAVEEVAERLHEGILAGRGGCGDNGDVGAIEELNRVVMRRADRVRREAVMKAVGSLSGPQTVKFLVAVGSYHLGLRHLGLNFPLL